MVRESKTGLERTGLLLSPHNGSLVLLGARELGAGLLVVTVSLVCSRMSVYWRCRTVFLPFCMSC
jgi:hypothetical protein